MERIYEETNSGKIIPKGELVRCKDCVYRWRVDKCVLAAIAAEKDCPLFMLDNRGMWFCADGERARHPSKLQHNPLQL